jgi:hypothetical protein
MLLEAILLGLCTNVGHCNELSNQYFYYNPAIEIRANELSDMAKKRAESVLGPRMMNGLVPFVALLAKREATIPFFNNQTVFFRFKPTELGVIYSYNF